MELSTFIMLALGLGLLHALDIDHLLAVSGISGLHPADWRRSAGFSLRWALGHGSSVLFLGSLVFVFGMAVPRAFSHYAEMLVGMMLFIIGSMLLLDWWKQTRGNAKTINQAGFTWSGRQQEPYNILHQHRRGTVVVGLIHGTAGTAPLLLLMPLADNATPLTGMLFLLLFSVGVLLSMLLFGSILGKFFGKLLYHHQQGLQHVRLLLSILTISLGLSLLVIH